MSKAKTFLNETEYTFWGDIPGLKKAMVDVLSAMAGVNGALKDVTADMIADQDKSPEEVLKFTSNFLSVLQRNIDIKMDGLKKSFKKQKRG